MGFEQLWNNFTSSEKEQFQRCCRRLLKHTFIVKDKDEENRKSYFFIKQKDDAFCQYFKYMGFTIFVDQDNGVVMLRNDGNAEQSPINRHQLLLGESLILCCLFVIYSEQMRSGRLDKRLVIPITDLQFTLEKYGLKEKLDNKSYMSSTLAKLSGFNLIDIIGKVGDEDCRIRLYPSLQFALDEEGFRNFVKEVQKKLSVIDEDDNENEDTDEDEDEAEETEEIESEG